MKLRIRNKLLPFSAISWAIVISFQLTIITGCASIGSSNINYRSEMRNFVIKISDYAQVKHKGFKIIPQNGHELLTENGEYNGPVAEQYVSAINGIGREDLFYGYEEDDKPTPRSITDKMILFLDLAKERGLRVLVTDYCSSHNNVDYSYSANSSKGYISFAASSRGLDEIPPYPAVPYNENSRNIGSLNDASNFLYLINPEENYESLEDFMSALKETNYDILIIDLFFNGVQLTEDDVNSLKIKANGGTRLVVCYMSIGEAEDYRYYWRDEWVNNPPSWLVEENPQWPGNYKVKYWDKEWQSIILGNENSYLDKILDSGFDGAYLDIIDAYEYFEELR